MVYVIMANIIRGVDNHTEDAISRTMANIIRGISKYSEDAISVAISHALLINEDRQKFEENLKAIAAVLEETPVKKRKKTKLHTKVPTNTWIFYDAIIPKICENVSKFEHSDIVEWNLDMSFIHKFKNYQLPNIEIIKETHTRILDQVSTSANLSLVIAFHRGWIYLRARHFIPEGTMKEWYKRELGVAYETAQRYTLFTILIQTYPRLMFAGLCFSQFSKHHNELVEHLATDIELSAKLKQPLTTVTICAQNICLEDIIPATVQNVPTAKLPLYVDPDYVCESNHWYNPGRTVLCDKEVDDFLDCLAEEDQ